ncbi:hypothetical protein [Rhodococcus sp. NPDC006774]|uniref:hypothetical protein n=1 Tax=Rhodococcus sp. NPDC006774 TaxID=3157186 RepID=UPI0033C64943
MMEEHENEERELTSGMERSLAASIAAAAALIESFARRRARRDRDAARHLTGDTDRTGGGASDTAKSITEQAGIQTAARAALAAGREDSEFWRTAPTELLHEKIIAEHGIDPRRVGEFGTDQQWITQAPGPEVLSVYAAADRWAELSEAAASVRENIATELSNYGLNIDELQGQPRGGAAEQIHTARAEYWAQRGYDPDGTAAEQADAAKDGEHVEQLLTQAGHIERQGDRYAGYSEDVRATGDRLAADTGRPATASVGLDKTASRSEQITAHRGDTSAGQAAAVAAIDHPTHPRDAVTAKSRAPRRPAPRKSAARDRSHGR